MYSSPEDARKYDLIFHAYEAPASAASQVKSAVDLQKIISIATLAVAALLAVAGLIAPAWTARITDLAIALIIAALGWLRLYSAHKRADTKTREGAAKP